MGAIARGCLNMCEGIWGCQHDWGGGVVAFRGSGPGITKHQHCVGQCYMVLLSPDCQTPRDPTEKRQWRVHQTKEAPACVLGHPENPDGYPALFSSCFYPMGLP